MSMKSPILATGKTDQTDGLAEKVLSKESADSKKSGVESAYEFLKFKLGYSDSLARAATGYVPSLD